MFKIKVVVLFFENVFINKLLYKTRLTSYSFVSPIPKPAKFLENLKAQDSLNPKWQIWFYPVSHDSLVISS